ncbi:hypothetical protein G7Z17_g1288 [Cylindrodendrum hubeiense]|uniref:Pantothenate kinase n=1 Tax=Cylindrodendrum hubeiense TaxID=595255 RepID=A0A9P5LK77_9HYPO|nr:hypothetical protein G7Z17_g1288 [Cylindrodendrum hubeiense]
MTVEGMHKIQEFESQIVILALNLAPKLLASKALAARQRLWEIILPYYAAQHDQKEDASALIRGRAGLQRGLDISDEGICALELILPWAATTNTIPTTFWIMDPVEGKEYLLTKGTNVQWSCSVTQLDEKVWGPGSEHFDPTKWIDNLSKESSYRKSMIPFGGGKVLCPGRHLAEAEILGFLSGVVLGFEVEGVQRPAEGLILLLSSWSGSRRFHVGHRRMDEKPGAMDGSPLNVGQTELAKSAPGVTRLGIDIGISSIKLVWLSHGSTPNDAAAHLTFASFDSAHVDKCLAFIRNFVETQDRPDNTQSAPVAVVVTGKRAVEFQPRLHDLSGLKLRVEHEFDCQATGVEFLITQVPKTIFTYSEDTFRNYALPRTPTYPYLLANVGSGVSFLKISDKDTCEQIGGTHLGGGTLTGLLSVLTKSLGIDEMLDLAERGNNGKVDKLIGDIYGTDYNGIGMKKTAIASSFGKVFSMRSEEEARGAQSNTNPDLSISDANDIPEADVCRSLVFAIFNNIGQLANLHSELHNITNVYFAGPFIRGHNQTVQTLHIALNYYSKGQKRAYFVTHEDSLSAIGAFLKI